MTSFVREDIVAIAVVVLVDLTPEPADPLVLIVCKPSTSFSSLAVYCAGLLQDPRQSHLDLYQNTSELELRFLSSLRGAFTRISMMFSSSQLETNLIFLPFIVKLFMSLTVPSPTFCCQYQGLENKEN